MTQNSHFPRPAETDPYDFVNKNPKYEIASMETELKELTPNSHNSSMSLFIVAVETNPFLKHQIKFTSCHKTLSLC